VFFSCKKYQDAQSHDLLLSVKKAVLIVGNKNIEWQKRGHQKTREFLEKNSVKIISQFNCKGEAGLVLPILKKATELKPDIICIYQNSMVAATLMKNKNKLKFLNVPVIMANMFFKKKFHPLITGTSFISGVKPIFNLWKRILPNAKNVAILASANPFSEYLAREYEKYSKELGYKIVAKYIPEYGYQWKEAVEKINKTNADFLLIGFWISLKTRNGRVYNNVQFEDLKYWTVRNMKKGYASFFDLVVMSGLTFGVCNDLVNVGTEIGEIAVDVLSGKDVKSIPVKNSRFLFISINKKHAEMVGLKIPYDIFSNAKNIYNKFIGEYDDKYFKRVGGIVQPHRPSGWKWIPQ
jgi:ABC-type uncharacterized transport system substrate-binding protein